MQDAHCHCVTLNTILKAEYQFLSQFSSCSLALKKNNNRGKSTFISKIRESSMQSLQELKYILEMYFQL